MTHSARFRDPATIWRKATVSDPEYIAPDSTFGTEGGGWTPIDGYEVGSPQVTVKVYGERQDVRATEGAKLGIVISTLMVRWRMRWRNDIDASMEVTIHGDTDERFRIMGTPINYAGRKEQLEMMLEKVA